MSQDCLTYHINTDHAIVTLDDDWDTLARDNHAPHLVAENVLGRNLFEFISDDRTRYLFQAMLDKILRTGDAIRLNYRCDTPDKRRGLELEATPLDDGLIVLSNRIIRVETRAPVRLLDPGAERTDQFVTICSWCKKLRLPSEQWVEIEEAAEALALFSLPVLPQPTHTICEPCYQQQIDEISD